MPSKLIVNVNKTIPLHVLTAAAFGILLASCQKPGGLPVDAVTTWTIQMDASKDDESISYSVQYSPQSGGCKYATGSPNPTLLHVCPNDSLVWQATSSAKKSELVVFTSDGILASAGPATLRATDDQSTNAANVTSVADTSSTPPHEWYVAVFDKNKGKMHHGDPKIIIGR